MSSKNYDQKLYVRKFNLGNNHRRTRNKPKLCADCKEASNYVQLFSNKLNKIEGIVNNLKNLPQKKTDQFSIFKTSFILNNVPCELEYNLSSFALEDLQKLVIFTTPNCSKYSSSNKNRQNDDKSDDSEDDY